MSNVSFSMQRRPGVSPFKSPTAYHLRALVLDYLSHKCYTNTARAFINDSTVKALDADGDEILMGPTAPGSSPSGGSSACASSSRSSPGLGSLGVGLFGEAPPHVLLKQVQQRREIRELILGGRVDAAIELLNNYFPTVLSDVLPHQTHDPSPPPTSGPGSSASATPTTSTAAESPFSTHTTSFTYVSATSMEPPHLLLNLRILAFIEACRTRPLDIPASSSASSPVMRKGSSLSGGTAHPSEPDAMDTSWDDVHADMHDPPLHAAEDDSVEEQGYPREITLERLAALITKGQKLYALADALPNAKERELYRKELENVGGLLAYEKPEESPMSKYMSYERREALADQINRATLYRSGLSPISTIEVLARYTTVLWQAAKTHGVKARSGACLPPRIVRSTTPPVSTRPEDIVNEEVPAFDLRQFLDAKP